MKAAKHRVLIFPAGSEIGIEIFQSLKYSHHVEIFGATGKSDHAAYMYDAAHYVEDDLYVDKPDFINRFECLLQKLQIEFIYPTHDTVANFLAKHQSCFSATVVTSCAETNHIARHKALTYDFFRSTDFAPTIYLPPYTGLTYPLFLKPNDAQGGKDTYTVYSVHELMFYLGKNPALIVMEYLPFEELSVDCFTDFQGKLLFIGPRSRERIQMGISFRSTAIQLTAEIRQIADHINSSLSLNGAWFFQIKKDFTGKFKLLEFAPRQSSTMGLYRHKGVNFALLSLFNALGTQVEIMHNDYPVQLDRCLNNRYKAGLSFCRVYIDLDETLIAGKKIYEYVMAFLYQCRNRGIEIVLLTKHCHDVAKTLRECAISEHLFSTIVHLSDEQEKWTFIKPEGSIFIDNYWFDRCTVKEKLGIPVFDVDAIECLIN